jgi:hypothetical protein
LEIVETVLDDDDEREIIKIGPNEECEVIEMCVHPKLTAHNDIVFFPIDNENISEDDISDHCYSCDSDGEEYSE